MADQPEQAGLDVHCGHAFREPVGPALSHRYVEVQHRCMKKLLHTTDHACEDCGRTWPRI